MKSISSNSGDLESSLSLSSSLASLKRTYIYAIVSAKSKFVTFYCFTTETSTHDSIKQLLDQLCETTLQRYHLANNTVLYKFGGLIGDSLIYDLKKVKSLTLSATQNEISGKTASSIDQTNDSKGKKQNLHSTSSTPNSLIGSKKLSSSPKFARHLSYKGQADNAIINPAFIASLQFSGSSGQNTSGSYQSGSVVPGTNTLSSVLSFKQIYLNATNCKSYDNIINIINQQVHFCAQYLAGTTTSSTLIDLTSSPSPLTNSTSNIGGINRQNSASAQLTLNSNSKFYIQQGVIFN